VCVCVSFVFCGLCLLPLLCCCFFAFVSPMRFATTVVLFLGGSVYVSDWRYCEVTSTWVLYSDEDEVAGYSFIQRWKSSLYKIDIFERWAIKSWVLISTNDDLFKTIRIITWK
jgi:hypothetical protein